MRRTGELLTVVATSAALAAGVTACAPKSKDPKPEGCSVEAASVHNKTFANGADTVHALAKVIIDCYRHEPATYRETTPVNTTDTKVGPYESTTHFLLPNHHRMIFKVFASSKKDGAADPTQAQEVAAAEIDDTSDLPFEYDAEVAAVGGEYGVSWLTDESSVGTFGDRVSWLPSGAQTTNHAKANEVNTATVFAVEQMLMQEPNRPYVPPTSLPTVPPPTPNAT